MKKWKIKLCRKKITAPGYWEYRLQFVEYEYKWYTDEFNIRHHLSDMYLADTFRKKIPWYRMKSAAHRGGHE